MTEPNKPPPVAIYRALQQIEDMLTSSEEAISVKMGKDRVADHVKHGAQVITGTDVSCLMHMEGILRRQHAGVKVMHIAEILNQNIHERANS